MTPLLSVSMRREYLHLLSTYQIVPTRVEAALALAARIRQNRWRYEAVGKPLDIPWQFVGAIHSLESGLSFNCHLHNGDPLAARTVQVPMGRPRTGAPPYTWEVSAIDAMGFHELAGLPSWTIDETLYRLEGYNGWGYRLYHPQILSPYLWGWTSHYRAGKYAADGKFSPALVSAQCGGVVLLRLLELGGMT